MVPSTVQQQIKNNMKLKYITYSILTATIINIMPAMANDNTKSLVFSRVANPEIPRYIDFAEKKVDLDRVDMYERLDRELTSMTYTHGNTLLIIKRANKYFPILAPILKKNGIPSDMIYLACIESNLNTRAYSSAKAAGLWQFIPSTARQFGLEVNDEVDERYHIEKETVAACKYFKKAFAKYGNWESVAASYNGGMARITSELEAQQVSSAYDLYLVDETSRYIFRLLAMKIIMENPSQFGFQLSKHQLYQPIEYSEYIVTDAVTDWATWAKEHGITYAELREHNPWIRSKKLTNKTKKSYTIKIPLQNSNYRSRQQQSIYNSNWIID